VANETSTGKAALPWDDIATRTNESCKLKTEDELTGSACYSRFFRNGPLVAKEKGEEFKKEWYVHMKAAIGNFQTAADDDNEDAKVVKRKEEIVAQAVEQVKAEFWTSVTEVVNAKLEEGEQMVEDEVKAVYDRVGGVDE